MVDHALRNILVVTLALPALALALLALALLALLLALCRFALLCASSRLGWLQLHRLTRA